MLHDDIRSFGTVLGDNVLAFQVSPHATTSVPSSAYAYLPEPYIRTTSSVVPKKTQLTNLTVPLKPGEATTCEKSENEDGPCVTNCPFVMTTPQGFV